MDKASIVCQRFRFSVVMALVFSLLAILGTPAIALQVRSTGRFTRKGIVRQISAGQITVRHYDGERSVYKIQDKDENALTIGGAIRRNVADIMVRGSLPLELTESGMIVRMEAKMTRKGKSVQPINKFYVVQRDAELRVDAMESVQDNTELMFTIVGRVMRKTGVGLLLQVPKSRYARNGRIEVKVASQGTMEFEMDNLNRVVPGDTIESMSGVTYSNGDNVIKTISVKMTAPRTKIATVDSWHDQLVQKYGYLSDEPVRTRMVKSQHFILFTDISDLQAKVLIAKLETMYGLISKYYGGKRPKEAIECYVVQDFVNWEGDTSINGAQRTAIENGTGLTVLGAGPGLLSVDNRKNQKGGYNSSAARYDRGMPDVMRATVYSCDKHNVVQHEAVHAFCKMTFGSTGPTWYSEGMAEMGNYWRPQDVSVNIDPVVMDYLTSNPSKSMVEIVNEEQITGDSWQAYAWRWTLCHMLANNSNYSSRFKKLGINMMMSSSQDAYGGTPRDSFYDAFGEKENQLAFEYDQFLKNMSNGYRVGLCKWDWKTKAQELTGKEMSKNSILARKGWQATEVELVEGQAYDYVAKGKWKIAEDGDEISADGDRGEGQLVATVFNNYRLSETIELGEKGSFVAPSDGQLFLRCEDRWNELADNSGQMTIYFRLSQKK